MDRRNFIKGMAVATGMAWVDGLAQAVSPPGIPIQPAANISAETVEYGKKLWASVPDKVETYDDRHFPAANLNIHIFGSLAAGAAGSYHAIQENFHKRLPSLENDILIAQQNVGPWAGGPARDYVAWQAASGIENAVKTMERDTGISFQAAASPSTHGLSPGLARLQTALLRVETMASSGLAEQKFGVPLSAQGEPFHEFAKAFDLAAENIFNVLNKVGVLQAKAGWVKGPVPLVRPMTQKPAYPGI